MARAALPQHSDEVRVPDTQSQGHGQIVKPGRLPVSEFAFDRAGAPSPFDDGMRFPLPIGKLTYVHPSPDAPPMHL